MQITHTSLDLLKNSSIPLGFTSSLQSPHSNSLSPYPSLNRIPSLNSVNSVNYVQYGTPMMSPNSNREQDKFISSMAKIHSELDTERHQSELDAESMRQVRKYTKPQHSVIPTFNPGQEAARENYHEANPDNKTAHNTISALQQPPSLRPQHSLSVPVDSYSGPISVPVPPNTCKNYPLNSKSDDTQKRSAPTSISKNKKRSIQLSNSETTKSGAKRKRRSPVIKQLRVTKWQRKELGRMRACLWELRFFDGHITELSRRYDIPIRTLRRYRDSSLDPVKFPTANKNSAVLFSVIPGEDKPRPPREVCKFNKGFTWHAYEDNASRGSILVSSNT
jgi:hypothetical protein